VTIINDQLSAQAASFDDGMNPVQLEKTAPEGDERTYTIGDVDSATAATFDGGLADETIPEAKNFWWMLVVALFGAAGEKMRRAHYAKKKKK